jgi:hypothetical protein
MYGTSWDHGQITYVRQFSPLSYFHLGYAKELFKDLRKKERHHAGLLEGHRKAHNNYN